MNVPLPVLEPGRNCNAGKPHARLLGVRAGVAFVQCSGVVGFMLLSALEFRDLRLRVCGVLRLI